MQLRVAALSILSVALIACGGASTSGMAAAGAAPPQSPTDAQIASTQASLRIDPNDVKALERLAAAYLQKVREVGDPAYYAKADGLLRRAVALSPGDAAAATLMGTLELARHHFSSGLTWGERARALDRFSANALGVIGDAEVELGRYQAATATFQAMVDLRPDLSSYARVSYLRELFGDQAGAIETMQMAVAAGGPVPENTAYTEVLLGNLHFNRGDLSGADTAYHAAVDQDPGYVNGLAGLAQVSAAKGDLSQAIRIYSGVVNTYPAPQFVIALGDVYAAAGRPGDAEREYQLAAVEQRLYQAAGVDIDAELALFAADHHRQLADALAAARRAVRDRPGIYSYDALAWALYRSGRPAEALPASRTSHRLGTRDALLFFHTGMIEAALGRRSEAASDLATALAVNPHFSLLHAPEAAAELASLRAGA